MSGVKNKIEEGLGRDPFMTEWVTALTALDRQSLIFRLRKADYSKHKAIIQIAENIINLSFDPDKNIITWESKNPGFTLDCVCADWMYSIKPASKLSDSFETLVSPIFTVGNQQFDIVFKSVLSTGEHRVEKYNIATGPTK